MVRSEPGDRAASTGSGEDSSHSAGRGSAAPIPRDPATVASLFGLLSEEVRVRILEELAEASRNGSEHLTFSALRRRVGVDDSGRFNYHLGQLTGELVQKVDGGYALSQDGRRLVAALDGPRDDPAVGHRQ